MSYKKLEIWQLARELSIDLHRMTIEALPKYELYEEGSQIRRSIKSVRSNIVEGYGRRRYKNDFIRFLTCAHASCDETIDHLEILFETESLKERTVYQTLLDRLHVLGRKIFAFIQSVESSHQSIKEPGMGYGDDNTTD